MKKEIRKDVREYILSQVNETLARLGVNEKVVETREYTPRHQQDRIYYEFESAPIRQMPMMFKKLVVCGHVISIEVKDGDKYWKAQENGFQIVIAHFQYSYDHFDGGSNGCEIGRMVFLVDPEAPETFESDFGNVANLYVRKVQGLEI